MNAKDRFKVEHGFTLIEILVVIAIIGILAGISTIGVTAFRKNAEEKACQSDRKTIEVASQGYLAKTGSNPAAQDDDSGSLVVQKYLRSWPTSTSGPYHLRWDGSNVVVVSGPAAC